MPRSLLIVFLFCFDLLSAADVRLVLPGKDWEVEFAFEDFQLAQYELKPTGDSVRFFGTFANGAAASGVLFPAPDIKDSEACRTKMWAVAKDSPLPKTNIVLFEDGEFYAVRWFVKKYHDMEINQMHINAYLCYDGTGLDLHISKVNFVSEDLTFFSNLLAASTLNKEFTPDTTTLLGFASSFYMNKNYEQAAVYYEKVLEREQGEKILPLSHRRVVIDNLGMSYGISGSLDEAIRVLNFGIAEDPEYPMYYYNMACAYAEKNDLDNTIKYLKTACKFKKNMITGEEFPKAKKDPSFQKYLDTKAFKKVARKCR